MARSSPRSSRSVFSLVALLLVPLLGACGPMPTALTAQPTPSRTTAPGPNSPFVGTEWVLISLHGSPPLEDSHITLKFGVDQVSGFAGCNGYGGPYTVSEGTLSMYELALQAQLCSSPQGVMDQEETYIQALLAVANYQRVNDHLEMQDVAGETSLVFAEQKAYPMDPTALVASAWQLVSMNGIPPIEGSTLTLVFQDEHRVGGHAGCRDYVALYKAEGDELGFSYTAMLGLACPEEALLEQEEAYTTLLQWTDHYRLGEGQLELTTARGEVLIYEPWPESAQAELEGPAWSLLAFVELKQVEDMPASLPVPTDLQEGTEISLSFEGNAAGGSAGCNSYQGAYTRQDASLDFGAITSTEKACLTPEGVMEQEQHYLKVLADVTACRVYRDQLWLETGDGRALVFTARE